MTEFDPAALIAAAASVARLYEPSGELACGSVGAAALAASGEIFTGICLDTRCSLGFCAEHAAVAEMLKHRQSRILAIVAVTWRGTILPPCGRCRELIRQLDPANWSTKVILPGGIIATLADLLPYGEPAMPAVEP